MLPYFPFRNLIIIFFLLLLSSITFSQNFSPAIRGNFGIKANLFSGTDSTGVDDWAQGPNGTGVILDNGEPNLALFPYTTHKKDRISGKGESSVFITTSKVSDNPNTWVIGAGSASGKTDLINVYSHARRDGNDDLWYFIAAERLVTNGATTVDFEFMRAGITIAQNGAVTGLGADSGRVAGIVTTPVANNGGTISKPGSLLVVTDYGGSSVSTSIYMWTQAPPSGVTFNQGLNTGAFGWALINPPANSIVAAQNATPVSTGPWGTFQGSGGDSTNTLGALAFVEVGINISKIGLDDQNNCTNVRQVIVHSRTSPSFSSGLSDFVGPLVFDLNTCASISVNKLEDFDESFSTELDRSTKNWNLSLYKGSVAPANLLGTVTSSSSTGILDSLPRGTYVAVESDTANWLHLGVIRESKLYNDTSISQSSTSHTFNVFGGDSVSITFVNSKNRINTTTDVESNQSPATLGTQVTFTATVDPGTATGTIKFYDDEILLGTGTLAGGTATFAISSLSGGNHYITAVYSGDANFSGSISDIFTQVIGKANSTTSVNSNATPALLYQSITFTATVTPNMATGEVEFFDGEVSLGTDELSDGSGSVSTSSLTIGAHTISVVYVGDVNYNGSSSLGLNQQINNPVPTLSTISPSTILAGEPDFTMTVIGTNFVSNSVVRINGNNRATTFTSKTELSATILASDIAINGLFPVTVFNPTPGGGTSNSVNLKVTLIANSSISGKKFNDLDGDGVLDGGETGLQNWKIWLNENNIPIDSVLTDGSGNYTFDSIPASTYQVTEELQSGWVSTLPSGGVYTVVLADNQNVTAKDFGSYRPSSITVYKQIDEDGNFATTGDRTTIPWYLTIYFGDSLLSSGNDTMISASELFPGNYTITQIDTPYWYQLGKVIDDVPMIDSLNRSQLVSVQDGANLEIFFVDKFYTDTTKYRTLAADTLLSKKPRVIKVKKPKPGTAFVVANVANFRDTLIKYLGSLTVGIPQLKGSATAKTLAWIRWKKGKDMGAFYNAFHEARPSPFDSTRAKKPYKKIVKEQKPKLVVSKDGKKRTGYDNPLAAEMGAFRLNLEAGGRGVFVTVPPGSDIRNLEYYQYGSPFHRMSLAEIGARVDSLMTYWKDLNSSEGIHHPAYVIIADLLNQINNAFATSIDSVDLVNPSYSFLQVRGEVPINAIPYLEKPRFSKNSLASPISFEDFGMPDEFSLSQNYPNPFNPTTTIEFSLERPALVSLKIFNVLGQEVKTLIRNVAYDEGTYDVEFSASNLATGVYFYRLEIDKGKYTAVKKLMLLK
ncbi:MAG: Ig-like domain repeat protein [Ignavibacteriales bacterium]|nr:Ig-like domain repeat protein [Ignavibacteriales bacterium]